MTLKERLTEDMKAAMKGGDKERLGVIRLVNAAIKQREVDERVMLDDAQVLAVMERMLKQRRDSVSQFQAAGRADLVAVEEFEIGVIEAYLPAKLSEDELDALIVAAIAETGAAGPKDMGKVMGLVKTRAAGRADMGKASERIKARLAGT
ncbi:MAG: GatB/YqeY domain-containing protein [Xanthomonadales bacterium]|nr:GatB/YqeY domain-containing protein [Xanthomonadales bacterium]